MGNNLVGIPSKESLLKSFIDRGLPYIIEVVNIIKLDNYIEVAGIIKNIIPIKAFKTNISILTLCYGVDRNFRKHSISYPVHNLKNINSSPFQDTITDCESIKFCEVKILIKKMINEEDYDGEEQILENCILKNGIMKGVSIL